MRCKATDNDDSLSRSMMIKAKNTLLNASESIMCQRDRVSAFPDTGAPSHLRGAPLTKKIENTVQPIIGLDLRSTAFSIFDCDGYIERKLLAFATHTRLRQEEEWEIIYRPANDRKESKRTRDHFARTFPGV